MSHLLWRDACAMAKALRKHLANAPLTSPTQDTCQQWVHALWSASSLGPPLTLRPRHSTALSPSGPTVEITRQPGGGITLGALPKPFLGRRSKLSLTNEGLLRQVAVCGAPGAGRSETLLTLAINAATEHRGVVYFDSKGDNIMYAKSLASLGKSQMAGNLRVINLMTQEKINKTGHSLDLFDGFDATALASWLVDLLPERDQANSTSTSLCLLLATLSLSLSTHHQRRLRPSDIVAVLDSTTLLHQAAELPTRSAARYTQAFKQFLTQEPDLTHRVLATLSRMLEPLVTLYGHVFDHPHPEVGFSQLYRTPDVGATTAQASRLFLLVLCPAMSQADDLQRAVLLAMTSALRQSLLQREPQGGCNSLVIMDECLRYLPGGHIASWSNLQDRGCGVAWGCQSPQEYAALEHNPSATFPGTLVLMKQRDRRPPTLLDRIPHPPLTTAQLRALESAPEYLPGQAFVVATGEVFAGVEMDYQVTMPRGELFLRYVSPLPFVPTPVPSGPLVDTWRQVLVCHQRCVQWYDQHPAQAPSLSWCQETVARMLGYANWHEAGVRLSPSKD